MKTKTLCDFPNLWKTEILGNSCGCGCGGVKVLPEKITARTLAVSLHCRHCGTERVRPPNQKRDHRRLCIRCSRLPSIRFARYHSPKPNHTFRMLLGEALDRNALTLVKACDSAGINRVTVQRWMSGAKVPWRHSVERLAAVLDAPELIDAVRTKTGLTKVTCPDCGAVRNHQATQMRVWLSQSNNIDEVDPISWTGLGQC